MGIFAPLADLLQGEQVYSTPAIRTTSGDLQFFVKRRGVRGYVVMKRRLGLKSVYATLELPAARELSKAMTDMTAFLDSFEPAGKGH